MNFHASREYLDVLASVYFRGQSAEVEDVEVDGHVLRVLVVAGRPIGGWYFLDYHEPLQPGEWSAATRRRVFAPSVALRVVPAEAWPELPDRDRWTPAPYVEWSRFPTFGAYADAIRPRGDNKDVPRRRRRLEERLGPLVYAFDDPGEDVLALSLTWKNDQLRETGLQPLFDVPENVSYFHELRRRGLLVASTLRVRERLLASWIGVVHEGIWLNWIFARDRDPALSRFSVGRQLLASCLEESHRRGHRQFDFSTGDEPYKWFYASDARLLAPLGRRPLGQRVVLGLAAGLRPALSRFPVALAGARRVARRVKWALLSPR